MTLSEKQRAFPLLVARLIERICLMGYEVAFGEAYRTPEQAKWNEEHGKGISHSLHCSRLAIDLLIFEDGVWLTQSENYRFAGEIWESFTTPELPTFWGGRFGDGNHFSLSPDDGKTR